MSKNTGAKLLDTPKTFQILKLWWQKVVFR